MCFLCKQVQSEWAYYIQLGLITPSCRFVDRDAFARFAGIGIGCQQFQASQVLDIQVGPDHTAIPLDLQDDDGNSPEGDGNLSESSKTNGGATDDD